MIEVRLTAIRYLAQDIHLFELRRVDGATMPAAQPGAHIGLHLPNGMMRQYSLLASEEQPSTYLVGIKCDVQGRGGSRYVHEQLRVGSLLQIDPPRNNFPLEEHAPHTVLIAGGIGITPIYCMQQRLHSLGHSYELHYASRTRAEMAFATELSKLPQARLHIDAEQGGRVIDVAAVVAQAPPHSHLYCCGPAPMLRIFESVTASWPAAQVHVEYFTAKEEAALEGGFTVKLARSGRELNVQPGRSLLQVLLDAGVDIPFSCEEGICGSCETRVLEGVPDHRDAILSEEERAAGKTMMVCCSGSKTACLVLDL